ncbi:MAG: hypothetical protein QOJ03_2860, partial [Frankiaceae bacterium]|nr:hypothetical protein [Frankiaceae bacterium]
MERTSKTLSRVGVAIIGAATFLATPTLGVISASAAPATLTPISPWDGSSGGNISALNDGTNSAIHLEAELNQATAGDPAATAVRFSYCVDAANDATCDAAPVIIATDSTSPYATEWAPPASIANGTNVEIIYEALTGSTVLDSETRHFTVDNTNSTVHITSPADGGSIGVWDNSNPSSAGTFIAKGTNSSDNPDVAVTAFNGAGDVTQDATAHTWSAIVPGPDITRPGASEIEATANGTDSDEEIWANFYTQTLSASGFTVTPASQSAALSTVPSATSGDYTVTALDQNGSPIAGLDVIINASGTIDKTAGSAGSTSGDCDTTAELCARTDANGQVKFTDTLTTATTDTITVQTDEDNDGSYNSAVDEQRTVTFTAYNATPTTLTTTAQPSQANYAPEEYTASNPGDTVTVDSNGNPTGGTGTPRVHTHFVDQNGNALTNTVIANFNYAVDRVLNDGTTVGSIAATPCSGTTADVVGSCKTDAFGNIYLPHNAADPQGGSDTFRAWIETDGVGGESAGDTKASNLTLSFAGPVMVWEPCQPRPSGWCNTQAPINTAKTYTVDTSVGGTARNGDTITFDTNGSGILTVDQPAGTIRDSDSTAHCVSGTGGAPNGACQITVNDPNAESVVITATDTSTGATARLHIQFRSNSLAFRQAENYDVAVVRPVETNVPQSSGYGCFTDEINSGRPGDVVIAQYLLEDVNGNRLANITGSAALDHGYFTDIPASYDTYATWNCDTVDSGSIPWTDVTLNGTPGLGTKIGGQSGNVAPASNGTTLNFQTDNHGVVTMAVSIGRDSAFDQDGNVVVSPTMTVGNQTFMLSPLNAEYDYLDNNHGHADNIGVGHVTAGNIFGSPLSLNFTFSTNAQAVNNDDEGSTWNGGGYYNPSNTNPLVFREVNQQSLTGNIPTSQTRSIAALTRDSFGNLTRSGSNAVEVDTSGVGEVDHEGVGASAFMTSSFVQDVRSITIDNVDPDNGDCTPVDPCGTAGHQDVNGSWGVHTVDYQPNPGTPPPAFVPVLHQPSFNCDDPVAQQCVDPIGPVSIASLDWYIQAINTANGATYTITHTPSGKVFLVGTTVTEKVTATDQHGQPIVNLFVTFYGSGPGQQGCNVSCASSSTDSNGSASYTYAGNVQGNTQITGVVTPGNGSNNELARMVDKVGFDGSPTIHAPRSRHHAGRVHVFGQTRPGA